jgi:protein-L-isoaspartate O-methyltransferase
MCDVGHFYTSAKLALHSVSNEESVKIGFKELIRGMNDKKEPFEILRILKHMIKEPIDYKNMCTSLEVEPKRTRKWVSCHSTEIGIITGIASAVIAELIKVIIEQNWSLISQAFQSFVFSL